MVAPSTDTEERSRGSRSPFHRAQHLCRPHRQCRSLSSQEGDLEGSPGASGEPASLAQSAEHLRTCSCSERRGSVPAVGVLEKELCHEKGPPRIRQSLFSGDPWLRAVVLEVRPPWTNSIWNPFGAYPDLQELEGRAQQIWVLSSPSNFHAHPTTTVLESELASCSFLDQKQVNALGVSKNLDISLRFGSKPTTHLLQNARPLGTMDRRNVA